MIVLGLDLSLVGTGCVVLDDGKMKTSRLITSKPSGKNPKKELERLLGICKQISIIVDMHDPKLVCIEGIAFMSRNSGALSQLSGLNYLVRRLLHVRGIDFVIAAPTVLKKFVTGKGNSPKEFMLLETYKRYGVSFNDNNLCDAYGLARIAEATLDDNLKLTKFQAETLINVKNAYEESKTCS